MNEHIEDTNIEREKKTIFNQIIYQAILVIQKFKVVLLIVFKLYTMRLLSRVSLTLFMKEKINHPIQQLVYCRRI